MDIVFSSIGITRQKDGLTFKDVDYQGNKNLLEVAKAAGVGKFIYVSAFKGDRLRHLAIVKAHEDFVDELKAAGMEYTVMRPTGYFSDMGEFLKMAHKGRVYLIGKGQNKMNPIHGADLAKVCVSSVEDDRSEISVGGPQVMTYREMAELAFQVLDRPGRITNVPVRIATSAAALLKCFNKHQGELMAFFTTMMTTDMVAPAFGTHSLEMYFRELASTD